MFEQPTLRVIGYSGCDAFRCDDEATVGMDIKNTEFGSSQREYWCDAHARERRQQVSAHSKLLIITEYSLVKDCERDSKKAD